MWKSRSTPLNLWQPLPGSPVGLGTQTYSDQSANTQDHPIALQDELLLSPIEMPTRLKGPSEIAKEKPTLLLPPCTHVTKK